MIKSNIFHDGLLLDGEFVFNLRLGIILNYSWIYFLLK